MKLPLLPERLSHPKFVGCRPEVADRVKKTTSVLKTKKRE
jgi:hypothetical protein